MRPFLKLAVLACTLSLSVPAQGHEFWLDAVTYTPKVGAKVPIVLRNGTGYLGDSYPFQRKWIKRFSVTDGSGERRVKTVEGDDPAAEVSVPNKGLAIVAVERAPDSVDYKSLSHFLEVLEDEGLDALAARYRARADAPQKLQEIYSRFAKALLSVGAAGGGDKALGLTMEIVFESNPYLTPLDTPLVARVLHEGKPATGLMVKVFQRPPGSTASIEPQRLRTDAEGRIRIERLARGEVLLSAALFTPLAPIAPDEGLQVRWQSLWASTTFMRP